METGQSKQALLEYEWPPIFIDTNNCINTINVLQLLKNPSELDTCIKIKQ